jgi:hypothetical protein
VELARRAYDALSRHDWPAYISLMDEQVEIHSLLSEVEGGYRGHGGIRRWWDDFLGAFPDYTLDLEEVRDLGDVTLARLCGQAHGAGGDTPIVDPFWHPMQWRDGKCVWWRTCTTEEEALAAIEQTVRR